MPPRTRNSKQAEASSQIPVPSSGSGKLGIAQSSIPIPKSQPKASKLSLPATRKMKERESIDSIKNAVGMISKDLVSPVNLKMRKTSSSIDTAASTASSGE